MSRAEREREYFIRYNNFYFCYFKWSQTMAFSTTFGRGAERHPDPCRHEQRAASSGERHSCFRALKKGRHTSYVIRHNDVQIQVIFLYQCCVGLE